MRYTPRTHEVLADLFRLALNCPREVADVFAHVEQIQVRIYPGGWKAGAKPDVFYAYSYDEASCVELLGRVAARLHELGYRPEPNASTAQGIIAAPLPANAHDLVHREPVPTVSIVPNKERVERIARNVMSSFLRDGYKSHDAARQAKAAAEALIEVLDEPAT